MKNIDIPWVEKYRPKNFNEIAGRNKEIIILKEAISKKKPVLIGGPPGVGKTSLAYALRDNYDINEINASDVRNKEAILKSIGVAMNQQTLFFKPRLLLIDEVDGISGTKDRGGITSLIKILKQKNFPVILTANDPYSDKLKNLRKICEVIILEPLSPKIIFEQLKRIANLENLNIDDDILRKISFHTGGDLRAAINDLQMIANNPEAGHLIFDERDNTEDIMVALRRVFNTTDINIARHSFDNVNNNLDEIFLWVEENLPRVYKDKDDLSNAFYYLSLADLFMGRIKKWQYYRFYVYIYDLLSAGIAISKKNRYKEKVILKRSERPLKIWILKNSLSRKNSIIEKLMEKIHLSKKELQEDFDFIIFSAKNKEFLNNLISSFDLNNDEILWLKKRIALLK